MPLSLDTPIQFLPGVGPVMAKRLEKLEIFTVHDLLYHFPFRHEDRSHIKTISDLQVGENSTLHGTIATIQTIRTRTGKTIQKALFIDHDGATLPVTWFNQPYLEKTFKNSANVSLYGKVASFQGRPTLASPQYELISSDSRQPTAADLLHTGRIVPMYHQTAGVTSKWLRKRIKLILESLEVEEWQTPAILQQEQFTSLHQALTQIHFPKNFLSLNKALDRLKFDEIFLLQLRSQLAKHLWSRKRAAHSLSIKPSTMSIFLAQLPFALTSAQTRCLEEINQDLIKANPMNRLLQGDVGSGKTVLAAAAAYITHLNQLSSVIMAPTEILAFQHFQTLKSILAPFDIQVTLLTGSSKVDPSEFGSVIVGTHAVLHRQMPANLGLLVVDEQHRFGVEQRQQLLQQNPVPHVLSMTATPIPRTIALSLYADLDVSYLDELPPGRITIATRVVHQSKRNTAYTWIQDQITTRHTQAFLVCPLITDSETPKLDQVKAAVSEFDHIRAIFPQLKIGLLHGRMPQKSKTQVTDDFVNRKLDILVTTPVIEVGVDIPNATIMVIEGAERFGLASLHQLRGRVGRSHQKSYCLLFPTKQSTSRLKLMESTSSGLKLAEADLKLRGPGDLYGVKQSGYIDLKLASLADTKLLETSLHQVKSLLRSDPNLQHHPRLKHQLELQLDNHSLPN